VPEDTDATLRRTQEPAHDLEEGGLAGAVRTYEGDDLAALDPQVDVLERHALAEAPVQARDLDGLRGHLFPGVTL
jgi:hypothetical protein